MRIRQETDPPLCYTGQHICAVFYFTVALMLIMSKKANKPF